jgi:hypothetical protein
MIESPIILVPAYRRPELLNKVMTHLTSSKISNNIMISVDGLRRGADATEENWRKAVIDNSINWANRFTNIDVRVWDVNEGTTAHAQRIFPELFAKNSRVIAIEDDMLISDEGLMFLEKCVNSDRVPQIATAHTLSNHLNPTSEIRTTILPNQWGLCFNSKIYDEFNRFLNGKHVSRKKIYGSFFENYHGKTSKIVAAESWVLHFEDVISHPSYTDAIFACAALHLGVTFSVPWKSYIKDIAFEDPENRGITVRSETQARNHAYEPHIRGQLNYCHRCDRENNRIKGLGFRQIIGGHSFRIKQKFLF